MTIRPILLGTSLCVLSACGGSSVGTNADAVIVSPHVNFAELEGRYLAIGAEASTLPLSTSATMPSTGRASMNGMVLLIDPASSANSAAGQIDISVDFASNEVDGIASDFRLVSEGGMVVGGTLVLDADITHGVTSGFAGTLAGELIQEDAVNVSIDVEGDFYGDDAQILAGDGTGTYVGDGISGNLNAQILAH